jgi:pimeloyl-ACP methyl ester carboxylesterase
VDPAGPYRAQGAPTGAAAQHLDVDHWLVLGGSWGSALALAYTESYPHRISEMILWGVTTGRRKEFAWLFRGGVAVFFPEQWERLREISADKATFDTSYEASLVRCVIARFPPPYAANGCC